ncbi:hypothetical protein GCM10027167_26920 [Nocardia heshunensis]
MLHADSSGSAISAATTMDFRIVIPPGAGTIPVDSEIAHRHRRVNKGDRNPPPAKGPGDLGYCPVFMQEETILVAADCALSESALLMPAAS